MLYCLAGLLVRQVLFTGCSMAQTYDQERIEALATMQEDGFEVTLIKKGTGGSGELDGWGNPIPSTPDDEFVGFGIVTGFSAYYVAQGIAKAGDAKLIFCPLEYNQDYIDLCQTISGSSDAQIFAMVDGEQWRVIAMDEVKPTSVQVLAKFHLRK